MEFGSFVCPDFLMVPSYAAKTFYGLESDISLLPTDREDIPAGSVAFCDGAKVYMLIDGEWKEQ